MIVGVIRLVGVKMFVVGVLTCQFGFALRSFWQPVRTRNPGDCTQCGNDRHGNQPITTAGCRLFDGIGHTAIHPGDRASDCAVAWKRVKLVEELPKCDEPATTCELRVATAIQIRSTPTARCRRSGSG